jgi:hypothetical protein
MTDLLTDDFKDGSSFFGFMGVTVALVLASNFYYIQTWAQLMAQQRPAQESAVFPSGSQPWL